MERSRNLSSLSPSGPLAVTTAAPVVNKNYIFPALIDIYVLCVSFISCTLASNFPGSVPIPKRPLFPEVQVQEGRFETLDRFLAESLPNCRAESTRKAYENAFHLFEKWVRKNFLTALPAQPSTVCRYAASVMIDKPVLSRVLNAIPAIAKFHTARGYTDPCSHHSVKDCVEAFKRQYQQPAVQKHPLDHVLLKEILHYCLTRSLNRGSLMGWALSWGLYCLYRTSGRYTENAAVQRCDFDFRPDGSLIILFRRRKQDHTGRGYKTVILPSSSPYCFISLTKKYFSRLDRAGKCSDQSPVIPLIEDNKCDSTSPMPYIQFYKEFKKILILLKRDPTLYGLHSPKVGSIVELVNSDGNLKDVENRAGFAPGSGMAERYSERSLQRNAELDRLLTM